MDQTNISQHILPRLAHPLFLCLLIFGLGSCGGEEATETGRACASSDLIDQCPIGSTPEIGAAAASSCSGQASGSVIEENGEVVGGCRAVGSCTVLCKFNNPCGVLGVKQITRTEIICNQREGSCPDEVCDPGEDVVGPLQCPLDCGAACVDGQTGCVRSADGTPAQWDCHGGRYRENICPPGQRCEVIAQPTNEVEFQGRCVDEASGAGGEGGAGGTGGAGGGQSPVCGNGTVEAGEICDDGNDDDSDGCRNDCTQCGPERPTCAGGDTQAVRRCEAGEWVEESCEGGNICEDGACRPPRVCEDGDARCRDGDGSAAREQCVNGQWTAPELCQSGMVCVRGACEMACDEGLTRCALDRTNTTERCVNSVWVADRACGPAETCRLGQCVGVAVMCQDGQRRCSPDAIDTPQTCMNGNWTDGRVCPRGTECEDGECLQTRCLVEGRTRCSADGADVLETCLADGSWAPERCAEGCGTPKEARHSVCVTTAYQANAPRAGSFLLSTVSTVSNNVDNANQTAPLI